MCLKSLLAACQTCFQSVLTLAIMEREAREKQESQALQATGKTRTDARTARKTKAKDHEEQQSKHGESNASIKTAIVVERASPCAAAARPRRAVGAGSVSRTLGIYLSFCGFL